MLTDVILQEAAAEAERFLLSIVPEDGEPHVFSKRFERKMEKLIRRVKHPIRYQVMRVAAAVVLAIATLFGAVMAVSPEARAAVVGWVKSTFYEFYEYSNKSPQTNDVSGDADEDGVKYEYRLSVAPEGYWELQVSEKLDGRTYVYVNDIGEVLRFTYSYGDIYSGKYVETTQYKQYPASVNGYKADIYIALKENETNVIIWCNEYNVFFQIFGRVDQTQLISIAENVEEQHN